MKKAIALLIGTMMIMICTACGATEQSSNAPSQSVGTTQSEPQASTSAEAQPLASGLSGTCTGDNDNLRSVSLQTTGQYLNIEIPNPVTQAGESVMYSIMFTDPENDYVTQAGFKNVFSTGEYSRFIFDMNTSAQKNYPGEFASDFTAEKFSTNLPDPAIKGGKGTKWVATLSVDGQDVATCPADGSSATLE